MTTLANHIYAKMNAADEAFALVDQANQLSAKAQDQARIALNELREAMDLAYTSKGEKAQEEYEAEPDHRA